mmetsp:Transcript_16861/g.29199  ORF Transcript_16861/g.29199 Transcript_16861/m.29199 type:complete len:429 (+) Transcript_16861:394-1680(+)
MMPPVRVRSILGLTWTRSSHTQKMDMPSLRHTAITYLAFSICSSSVLPGWTSSWLTTRGSMAARRSMKNTLVLRLLSLKLSIFDFLPDLATLSLAHDIMYFSSTATPFTTSDLRMLSVWQRMICHRSARVRVRLASVMSWPPMPTRENLFFLPMSTHMLQFSTILNLPVGSMFTFFHSTLPGITLSSTLRRTRPLRRSSVRSSMCLSTTPRPLSHTLNARSSLEPSSSRTSTTALACCTSCTVAGSRPGRSLKIVATKPRFSLGWPDTIVNAVTNFLHRILSAFLRTASARSKGSIFFSGLRSHPSGPATWWSSTVYTSESLMSWVKFLTRRFEPAALRWWLTQRSRISSAFSLLRSCRVSPSSASRVSSGCSFSDTGASSSVWMICHSRPSTRCTLPSMRSWAPMLTTLQPMALAESMARFWFSVFS